MPWTDDAWPSNETASPVAGLAGANVMFACTLSSTTWTSCDTDAVAPWSSVTVSVTVLVPGVSYSCAGSRLVAVAPSPNAHWYVSGACPSGSEDPSENATGALSRGVDEVEKAAVGAWFCTTTSWATALSEESLAVTVSVTWCGPGYWNVCDGLAPALCGVPSPKSQS